MISPAYIVFRDARDPDQQFKCYMCDGEFPGADIAMFVRTDDWSRFQAWCLGCSRKVMLQYLDWASEQSDY